MIAGPLLVRPVIRVLGGAFPALFGPVGRMSQRNALRNPRRTGATAAALMVGLALVGGMSVASASMSKSFDHQIDKTLGSDFVIQNSNFVPFTRRSRTRCATEVPGSSSASGSTPVAVRLPDGKRVETTAAGYDPRLDDVAHVTYTQGNTAAALGAGHLSMDAKFAREHDVRVGSVIPVEFPAGRKTELTVGALTDQGGSGVSGCRAGWPSASARSRSTCPAGRTRPCT